MSSRTTLEASAVFSPVPFRLADARLTAVDRERTAMQTVTLDPATARIFARELASLSDELDQQESALLESDFQRRSVSMQLHETVTRLWARWLEMGEWLHAELQGLGLDSTESPSVSRFQDALRERTAATQVAEQNRELSELPLEFWQQRAAENPIPPEWFDEEWPQAPAPR